MSDVVNLAVAREDTVAGVRIRVRIQRVLDEWNSRVGSRWTSPGGCDVVVVECERPTRNGGWISYRYDGEAHVITGSRSEFLRIFRPVCP